MSKSSLKSRRITVGIVTFNSARVIGRTLESLHAAQRDNLIVEILVRDNGSCDGTQALVLSMAEKIDGLRLVPGGKNIGYGRGHNDIFQYAKGNYYVICNPDIMVGEDFFISIISFMENNQNVGLMSPRMTFEDGTLQYSNRLHPTVWDLILRRFMPKPFRGPFHSRMARYEMADRGYDESYDVPFCSGALMVLRKQAMENVGGFDDRYFLYFEDADICRTLQISGWRTVFNPNVNVVHFWQRDGHKRWRGTAIMAINACRYFNKWGWEII